MVLQIPNDGSLCVRVSGKQLKGKETSTGLLPRQVNIEVLSVIELLADGRRCTALVDSGCSKTLMWKSACRSWRPREAKVVTADRKNPYQSECPNSGAENRQYTPSDRGGTDCTPSFVRVWPPARCRRDREAGGVHIRGSGKVSLAAESVPYSPHCDKRAWLQRNFWPVTCGPQNGSGRVNCSSG